jgi:hypothetical protein
MTESTGYPADEPEPYGGEQDEGRRAADASPEIAEDAEKGQTQVPAAGDDVGVPSDEQLGEEGAAEGESP